MPDHSQHNESERSISKRTIRRVGATFAVLAIGGAAFAIGRETAPGGSHPLASVGGSTTVVALPITTLTTTTMIPPTTAIVATTIVPATTRPPTPAPVTSTTPPRTTLTTIDAGIEVYGDCTMPTLEPTAIVLTCADGGEVLQGLEWVTWTATSATAVGTLVYNDCTPDCADGHDHSVPGTKVTLTAPVHGPDGQLVWSEIQENPEPPGYATGPYQGGPQPLPTQPD
jgi:hypothetical protein